jgi:hypothetical protein
VGADVFGFGLLCPGLGTAGAGPGEGDPNERQPNRRLFGFPADLRRPSAALRKGGIRVLSLAYRNPFWPGVDKGAQWLNFAETAEPC